MAKILYVHPTPSMADSSTQEEMLRQSGLEFDVSSTRSGARECLDRGQYAGVFMGALRIDPGQDPHVEEAYGCGNGIALARDARTRRLPVVVASGGHWNRQLGDLGVIFLGKPYSLDACKEATRRAFG